MNLKVGCSNPLSLRTSMSYLMDCTSIFGLIQKGKMVFSHIRDITMRKKDEMKLPIDEVAENFYNFRCRGYLA